MLKSTVEVLLARGGPVQVARALHRGRVLALAYHNVLPAGVPPQGDRSLHLARRDFADQLDALLRTHDVVPLEECLEAPAPGRGRPRVVITFDDAYRGAVTVGVEELRRRGLPATIFVSPALLGSRNFWWDAFADPRSGLPDALRSRALAELDGCDARVRHWCAARGIPSHPLHPSIATATEDELAAAARVSGISVASHGWSHRNLARLSGAALVHELLAPLRWLSRRFDRAVPWVSYPYGLATPQTEAVAARLGYRAALRVDGGWIPATPRSDYALPRLNVPAGISTNGFRARIDGLV